MIAYRVVRNIISLFILSITYRYVVKCYETDQLRPIHENTGQNATEIEMSKEPRTVSPREMELSWRKQGNITNSSEEFDIEKHLAEKKKKKKYEPNIYEPYWSDGEIVFERTAPPWRMKTIANRTSGRTLSPTTPNIPNHSCNQICPIIYETYGPVCGIYVHNIQNRVTPPEEKRFKFFTMDFENACELERENCRHPTKEWYISYKGRCLPPDELKATPVMPDKALSKARFWAPFNYTTQIWMLNKPGARRLRT